MHDLFFSFCRGMSFSVCLLAGLRVTGANNRRRRLLISQDHNEIYLNVAEFDWKYVEYIQGKRRPDASNCFLKMREYGPFRLNESGHMKWLGKILLGVTIAGGIMNSV